MNGRPISAQLAQTHEKTLVLHSDLIAGRVEPDMAKTLARVLGTIVDLFKLQHEYCAMHGEELLSPADRKTIEDIQRRRKAIGLAARHHRPSPAAT